MSRQVHAVEVGVDMPSLRKRWQVGGDPYMYLAEPARWLARHVLLLELGLPEEVVTELIERNPQFHGDLRLLERMNNLD